MIPILFMKPLFDIYEEKWGEALQEKKMVRLCPEGAIIVLWVFFLLYIICFWIFVCSFVSWCKPVLLWISFSELLLLHSINFGMLYFCSHFSLDIFKFLHWYHWWPIFSSAMCCIISMFLCISHFLLVIDF